MVGEHAPIVEAADAAPEARGWDAASQLAAMDQEGLDLAVLFPSRGLFVLGLGTALFITVNLAIGFTISTLTQNQLQAMQASVFILLPSILLSGFMFPFRGMPLWAQYIGETLPATHFMRIARGLMLKGATVGAMHTFGMIENPTDA